MVKDLLKLLHSATIMIDYESFNNFFNRGETLLGDRYYGIKAGAAVALARGFLMTRHVAGRP